MSYRVVFSFSGFAAPIVTGAWNSVKAGDGVPLKFSLGGGFGLSLLVDATVQSLDCDSAAPLGAAVSASGSFTYNGSLDRYMLVWPTEKAWAAAAARSP